MYSRDLFPKNSFFSHKNGTFYKQELWTSLAAAAALSSCWCVKTVYGIWIYTSVFIKLFSHVDHETLGVMAEYRNQNFIFTLYMILLAFEKKNSFILFFFLFLFFLILFWFLFFFSFICSIPPSVHLGQQVSGDAGMYTPARAASDDAVLASDDY